MANKKKKLFEEISNAEYRSREGISSSDLKKMMKSMATYKWYKDNPEDSDSQALLFGRFYHKFILENDCWEDEFAVAPYCDKRTKAGKEAWEQFCKENEGKDIVTQQDYETVVAMREAFMKTPFAPFLIKGEHEKSFFWTDEKTGVPCKCRPDSIVKIKEQYVCIDLKTTTNAETDAFMKQSYKLGYDLQAEHYCQGLKHIYGEDFKFIFIAQEKTEPYLCNVLEADEYFMQSGKELRNMLLEQYDDCCRTGNWYGLMGKTGEISSLSAPKWIRDSLMLENDTEEFE